MSFSLDDSEIFWSSLLGSNKEKLDLWYNQILDYWEQVPSSNHGMLGGYESVSTKDLAASLSFLKSLKTLPSSLGGPCNFETVLDCGAGIGRITKGCLLNLFKTAEILEPVQRFLNKAMNSLDCERITGFHCCKIQDYIPKENSFDCIWIQWCTSYLTDQDLISFLIRCKPSLKNQGVVCLKDNVLLNKSFLLDEADKAVTRPIECLERTFQDAGYIIIIKKQQLNFPKVLQPVFMYCLRPA